MADNANADPAKLRLKYHKSGDIDYDFAITQIECRKKYAKKLSQTLARYPEFLFPSALAGEQCTSDLLARYHATLVNTGDKVVDLTAGLGIDAWHISNRAGQVTAIELDPLKAECLKDNYGQITAVHDDCRDYILRSADGAFDIAFIDPARRAVDGGRVFALSDCQPDVLEMMPQLKRVTKKLIIKASPMLDITNMLRSLPYAANAISLGTPTECKELVAVVDFTAEKKEIEDAQIEAVTILNESRISQMLFTKREESSARAQIAEASAGKYLLVCYPAVMKAAAYNLLSERFGIGKISANTQLYVADAVPEGFPGEAFKIEEIVPYESKYIKRLKSRYPKIMVSVRNFDISADALRAKLGVKDGGDKRLFAYTDSLGRKFMAITDSRNSCRLL